MRITTQTIKSYKPCSNVLLEDSPINGIQTNFGEEVFYMLNNKWLSTYKAAMNSSQTTTIST